MTFTHALRRASAIGLAVFTAMSAHAQTTHRPAMLAAPGDTTTSPSPFADNNGQLPPKSVYPGPLFKLNGAWPQKALPPLKNPPWQAAINGQQINTQNAQAYANALRDYVAPNAKTLIMNYDGWDASKAGWYNEPWLGSLREAIRGTYAAGEFGPGIFPGTGLRATFSTHVLTYYDARAAYSLYKLWGTSAMDPAIKTANAQFAEGSVIVKAAVFTSTDPKQPTDWWDAMKGAQPWQLYIDPTGTSPAKPQVWPGYVAQFDIIVKDSKSAPKTGWVFMTLVYDNAVPGDAWDKMIPLGAQWGNDPQATKPGQPLVENWINPKAPKYATQTLGWMGRLSGPNDGARNNIAVNGKVIENAPDSSCMSCHSTAQWNVARHRMDSFLLPSFSQDAPPGFKLCGDDGKPKHKGQNICSPAPASAAWMKWFTNRLGTQPMDKGSVAMDFDEVFSFKSLPMWWAATHPTPKAAVGAVESEPAVSAQRFNQYTGAPLPKRDAGK
ncbi:hypothetical protein [Aquabacterium sp. NJ1]|uniref:hypothetical protein n=1 Tax=Aquabacterium sp. NJ1 TaxID=1538295 RepID=UPI00069011E5|nr:hypothetical protein [Aquabacterium sp. NJ1]